MVPPVLREDRISCWASERRAVPVPMGSQRSFLPFGFPLLLLATPCFSAACTERPRCSRRSRRTSHRLDGNPSGCGVGRRACFFFLLVPLDVMFSPECSRYSGAAQCFPQRISVLVQSICVIHCLLLSLVTTLLSDYPRCNIS